MSGSDRRLAIIGGCGFIGCNLIACLNRRGFERITVMDNESVGRRDTLDGLGVERFVPGDIRDAAAVEAALAGQDAVVLLAAQTNVMRSIADPWTDFDINARGGLTVLQAAAEKNVETFIFASSSAPLGAQQPPMHEELAPRPASPYGASKLAMEGYCSAFFHAYGLKTVSLRFSNCYGPGSRNKSSVVAQFIRRILAGEPLTIYGDGTQTRDFIFVQDLCRGIAHALEGPAGGITPERAYGALYQVATGVETSINELLTLLEEIAASGGFSVETQFAEARAGEVVRSYADCTRFRDTFGFDARIPLREGLKATWDYFRSIQ